MLPNLRVAISLKPVQNSRMTEGRLIRVSKYRGDPAAKAYLVAVPDKVRAMNLIAANVAQAAEEIEDLGRVSDALIASMFLAPGDCVPIDGVRHVAQQQQQPQAEQDAKKQ